MSRLITLGTPHAAPPGGRLEEPISRVNHLFPGALHEGSGLRYLSVAGAAADGNSSNRARRRYEGFVEDGRTMGDGVVPVEAALLPGSEALVLDGLYHNRRFGRWYGSDEEIERLDSSVAADLAHAFLARDRERATEAASAAYGLAPAAVASAAGRAA